MSATPTPDIAAPMGSPAIALPTIEPLSYANSSSFAFFKSLKLEFKIKFLIETKPLGTIGSLSLFKKKNNNNDIFVSNCDVLVNSDLAEIYDFHKKHDHDLTIVTAAKNFKVPYGVCETSAKGIFKNIVEKYNLELFNIEKLKTHGGSIRYFIKKISNSKIKIQNSVKKQLKTELKYKLHKFKTYIEFKNKDRIWIILTV